MPVQMRARYPELKIRLRRFARLGEKKRMKKQSASSLGSDNEDSEYGKRGNDIIARKSNGYSGTEKLEGTSR